MNKTKKRIIMVFPRTLQEIFPEILLLHLVDDEGVPAADVIVLDPVHVGDLLAVLLPEDAGLGVRVHVADEFYLGLAELLGTDVAVDEHLCDLHLWAVLHHHLHQLGGLAAVSVTSSALIGASVLPGDVTEGDDLTGDVSRPVRHHLAHPGPADCRCGLASRPAAESHVISFLDFQQGGSAQVHRRRGWN